MTPGQIFDRANELLDGTGIFLNEMVVDELQIGLHFADSRDFDWRYKDTVYHCNFRISCCDLAHNVHQQDYIDSQIALVKHEFAQAKSAIAK